MRVILIAAGMGSRLEHHTQERPKCMVEVGGRSILDHQQQALRAHGPVDLHIIRGYLADRLVVDGATYYDNVDYRNNNILHSLFCAESAIEGDVIITYSDIVYTPEVVAQLLASPGDISLVVDRRWADAYDGREDHPVGEAELAEVNAQGRITEVGKHVGKRASQTAAGEFIGLMRVSAEGARWMREAWAVARANTQDDAPFQSAKLFRKAYLTDLIEAMIAAGRPVTPVLIEGGWREIDTVEDLERVNRDFFKVP
jgi:L-glutamine-phosphate cytidylyltransferase